MTPEISIISSGRNNRFGHPSEEVIKRLNKFGTKILRTDIIGGVLLRSDGEKIEIINWKEL